MDDQLKHFSHEHPLMYKEEAPPENEASGEPVLCSACGERVLGSYYSCNQCSGKFILHKPCAQLGREIQHPTHKHPLTILTKDSRPYRTYICDMCGARSDAESYSCYKCEFDLDFKCAADRDCINHFSHTHVLKFIEKPYDGGSPAFCIGCSEPVLGPYYTCKRLETERNRSCSIFLHKSCAELPRKIKHPMHHQHKLTLNLNAKCCIACDQDCSRIFSYSCFKCHFNLDLKCASEQGFHHFSHNHSLIFKKQGTTKRETDHLVLCDACQVPVSGPSYTCINIHRRRRCSFNLHKSCADLPIEIQHPAHRQHRLFLLYTIENIKVRCFCNACNQPCRYRYSCSVCDFNLDLKCSSIWQNIIENDSHQHQFIVPRKELAELQLICDICGEYWSGIIVYICSICQLLVHEDCASFPRCTNIPGHQHGLKITWFLEDIYPKDQVCKICSMNVDNCRAVYFCQECGVYVAHTTCILQKEESHSRTVNIDADDDDDYYFDNWLIAHFSHQHILFKKYNYHHQKVKDDKMITCEGCFQPITENESYYGCIESCQFKLHKKCARLPKKILLPLLHQHQFTLLFQAPSIDGVFQCYMCGIFHHGFVYSCEKCALQTGKNLLLDPECGMYWESRDLKHESHAHSLLLDINWEDICCRGCGSKLFFCFSCKKCNYHLCIACVRLPLTGRHRYDKHVLKLTYASRPEDIHVGYYCVVCEGKRDPAHWFYWCEDCKFDCHPHCIIGRYPRVKLGGTYKHKDHVQHQVTLVSKWKSPIRGDKRDNILPCERCHELCQGLVYECRECNIIFHRDGGCGTTDKASSSRSAQIEELIS